MIFYSSNRFGQREVRYTSGGGIGCLVLGVLGLVAAYFILKGLFYVLYWASPALFVLALIINWRAVADTFKNWFKSMETNPLGGLLIAALAVLAFPFFTFYLFLKALGYNKIQQFQKEFGQHSQPAEDAFTEFEELESVPKTELKTEQNFAPPPLPEKEPEQPQKAKSKKQEQAPKPENPYDKLFD